MRTATPWRAAISRAASASAVDMPPRRTYASGACRCFSVAIPAAMPSGFPDSVPAWYTGPTGATRRISSARPPYAATGSPPPITLPRHVRSGCTPKRDCAPPYATRNPVITSSKTSTAPCTLASRRSPSR